MSFAAFEELAVTEEGVENPRQIASHKLRTKVFPTPKP